MRNLSMAVLTVSALATMPAAAQIRTPGPTVYQQDAGIPAPRGMVARPQPQPLPQMQQPPRVDVPASALRRDWRQSPRTLPNPPRQAQRPDFRPDHRQANRGHRWGGVVGGRWWGGSRAPGGWNSYRRPSRGWSLPGYWMSSNFGIPDYYSYGLRAPGNGYSWVRYYDDAVMVDRGGRVIDWADGIAWNDQGDYDGYYDQDDSWGADSSYAYSDDVTYDAGRYGEASGYPDAAPTYGATYGYPGGYAPQAPAGPPPVQVRSYPAYGGGYSAGYGSNSYYGGGYYAGGGTTTTVVIQPAPMVTTTTVVEEVIEESVSTRTHAAPRRAVRRPVRKYRAKPRPVARQCSCQCVCR